MAKLESYITVGRDRLRCGYTTGTCAAAASLGAARRLVYGAWDAAVSIRTPAGIAVTAELEELSCGGDWAMCAVRKDGGDDPDVTDGALVFSRVRLTDTGRVEIDGGEGVGRVTRPGLDQPVGSAAINSVPRRMIQEEAFKILEEYGVRRPLRLTVSAPEGVRIAEKTFNPVLGIEGGISILGTSGIVKPMSSEALVETIRAQLKVLYFEGRRTAAAVPGNLGAGYLTDYGFCGQENTLRKERQIKRFSDSLVICSNFIGRTVDMAGELGFSGLLLAGHIGKLGKLGNGIMDTHSREGDARLDTLLSCALEAGADRPLLLKIRRSNTTEEAIEQIEAAGFLPGTMERLMERIGEYLGRRAPLGLETEAMVFDASGRLLGKTKGADRLLSEIRKECEGNNEGQNFSG